MASVTCTALIFALLLFLAGVDFPMLTSPLISLSVMFALEQLSGLMDSLSFSKARSSIV